MVMTKAELIGSLQNEVRILLHLTTKIDRAKIEYRPTGKQRSILELLNYLSMMGPEIIEQTKAGKFDTDKWAAVEKAAMAQSYDQALARIAAQTELYAQQLNAMSDADLRSEVNMFGQASTRGAFLVNLVLCGCAAYRTQLFCYLKSCGREELGTYNLWAGMDAPVPA